MNPCSKISPLKSNLRGPLIWKLAKTLETENKERTFQKMNLNKKVGKTHLSVIF